MREIKFRAWDEENKEWIYFTIDDIVERRMTDANNLSSVLLKFLRAKKYQYTGMKDKNGKEIYEGDIIQNNYWVDKEKQIYEVKWDNYNGYEFHQIHGNYIELPSDDYFNEDGWRVIGNVFENPELMEEEK